MSPPYMKLFIGDYLADTTHLTTAEHGAYLLLLMAMWRAGGKLPADDGRLAKLTLCTAKEWAAIKPAILAFFKVSRGRLTHKRLAKEMAKYDDVSRMRKTASQKAVLEKANKNSDVTSQFGKRLRTKRSHNQNQNQREIEEPNSSSNLSRRASAPEPDGGSGASAPVSLEEIRDRIAAQAAEMARRSA